MNIAIIPARFGSKRIKNKNIKFFFGFPIIYWSLKKAKQSKLFKKIIVSTDNEKIANIAIKYGAEVPFIRPKKFSNDKVGIDEVMIHAIRSVKNLNPKYVCCINATAPFISTKDLIAGFKKIKKNKFDYVFSAVKYDYPIQRSFQLKKKKIKMIFPKFYKHNTQDLEENYHDAGQFYWGSSEAWLKKKRIFSKYSSTINIQNHLAQDIDTIEDWKKAQLKYKILYQNEKKK
ncbi:MAG: pseudaminic acid cytidylyltransferase [Rickettsiales bacterium]|nr:pseudaminic acid cytidylyltransferase [Rickettsiales bacterium]